MEAEKEKSGGGGWGRKKGVNNGEYKRMCEKSRSMNREKRREEEKGQNKEWGDIKGDERGKSGGNGSMYRRRGTEKGRDKKI